MNWLDEKEFYELCQAYRMARPAYPEEVVAAFDKLKEYIREKAWDDTSAAIYSNMEEAGEHG